MVVDGQLGHRLAKDVQLFQWSRPQRVFSVCTASLVIFLVGILIGGGEAGRLGTGLFLLLLFGLVLGVYVLGERRFLKRANDRSALTGTQISILLFDTYFRLESAVDALEVRYDGYQKPYRFRDLVVLRRRASRGEMLLPVALFSEDSLDYLSERL